jgi:hypothetical protein
MRGTTWHIAHHLHIISQSLSIARGRRENKGPMAPKPAFVLTVLLLAILFITSDMLVKAEATTGH